MTLGSAIPAKPTRFAWVLQGAAHGPSRVFDEDLAAYPDAAVLPTQGALLAEWLLIVPRAPCLAIAALSAPQRLKLLEIAELSGSRMSSASDSIVMFEHGSRHFGSQTGCGVDQAHLHVVSHEMISVGKLVSLTDNMQWEAVDHLDPWASMPAGSEYLIIRDRSRAVRALVDRPISQHLRRAVASVLGRPDEWDYRVYPQAENAMLTKQIYRSEPINCA